MTRSSVLFALLLLLPGCSGLSSRPRQELPRKAPLRRIERAVFGNVDGKPVHLFTLTSGRGLVARITDYGAILTGLHVPDRQGRPADVVLGFDTLDRYLGDHPHFGGTVGRVANRIAMGRFSLDGKDYQLATNNGPNHLHGGVKGFDRQVWDAETREHPEALVVSMRRVSPDGEEGYPGTLTVNVSYTLTEADELKIEMTATTDRPTIVNLAHHSYWNLAGHSSGDILGHVLQLNASRYTPTDEGLIPTGVLAPVAGTPYDFTRPRPIGAGLASLRTTPPGYDINYVLDGKIGDLRWVARAHEPRSGRRMELLSTAPGVQLYTDNFREGVLKGKGGASYRRHQGFCLETQHHPDSVNKPDWPTVVLRPGQTYRHVMVHRFY